MKDKKMKEEKTENNKQEKPNKFMDIIKKKWLVNATNTFLLVIFILAFFAGVSLLMQKLQLTPIDLTEEKLYTLTDQSKEQVKNLEGNINIYFVGYQDDDPVLDLARQYSKVNDKIKVESVTATDRPDLVEKYGIETGSNGIIVENGDKYKVLSSSDLYTYDSQTYETINIAEEKLTSSLKSVALDKLPKVYFLDGYSQTFSLSGGLQYLNIYLQNEVNEVERLDIISTGKVPEDCNTLVITSPESDFDEIATNAIIDYINNGGNILWLNAAVAYSKDFTNVNKVLSMYGVNPFEVGAIRETNPNKMVSNSPDLIMPEIQYSNVTNKVYSSEGVILVNATRINVVNDDKLAELNTTKTELIKSSEDAYFRTNFNITANAPQSGEETGAFLIGAQFDKIVKEANEETEQKEIISKLIIYGENYFITDYQLTETAQTPMVQYRQNKDLVLNSIAYLSNREEDIAVRKSTGSVTYTATEQQNRVILAIITLIPIAIIIIGIVVWIVRKRKK